MLTQIRTIQLTWNRIRFASPPAEILGWAVTAVFPNWAVPPLALLFKIVPSELTSKSPTELLEKPLELGADILVVTI